MVGMAQFTLKQMLLAMTCFSVAFAALAQMNHSGSLAGPSVVVVSVVAGIGILQGRFCQYASIALLLPVAAVIAMELVFIVLGMFVICGYV